MVPIENKKQDGRFKHNKISNHVKCKVIQLTLAHVCAASASVVRCPARRPATLGVKSGPRGCLGSTEEIGHDGGVERT